MGSRPRGLADIREIEKLSQKEKGMMGRMTVGTIGNCFSGVGYLAEIWDGHRRPT